MKQSLVRRAFMLGLSIFLAAAAGCSPKQWSGPFFFIQMADTQLGMADKDASCRKEMALFEKAVDHVNRLKPAFVVICGDLINRPGDDVQAAAFHRVTGRIDDDIPLFLVAGNHDVGNAPTPASLRWYRERFGQDVYAYDFRGCRFVVLNSTLICNHVGAEDEFERQEQWLRNELPTFWEAKPAHVFVFQHHPLFVKEYEEPDEYMNIPRDRRIRYLEMMVDSDVTAVFAGHFHRNGGGKYGPIDMIVTGSVTNPFEKLPPGFRIVKVFRNHIEHDYHSLDDMPESVDMKSSSVQK